MISMQEIESMKKFEGLYTALVTPFDQDGKINADAIQKLVDKNLKQGVNGFYVSGSTGESYLLSMEERKYLLETVSEAVDKKADIIVNIGMFATEHSIELAQHAEKKQVSAISSVPPFYFPFNMKEYISYYKDLADAISLPVIVYNIPAMSSISFSLDDIEKLFEHEGIAGIKHTSYDLFQLQQMVQHYPEKSIFIGHDEIYLSALAAGVKAGIGSTYNIMANKFVKIKQCFENKQMEEALKIQNEVNEIVQVLCKVGVFKGVKAILKMQGIDCGVCRKPFLPLNTEELCELKTVAERNGIL